MCITSAYRGETSLQTHINSVSGLLCMQKVIILKLLAAFLGALEKLCVILQALGRQSGLAFLILVPCASWETIGIPVCRGPKAGTVSLGKGKPGKQAQDLKRGCAWMSSRCFMEKDPLPPRKLLPLLPADAEGRLSHF